tara:strand:- start:1336 stop:1554 length:219 start_codon:yes stop_codon:yes gene_type:complete
MNNIIYLQNDPILAELNDSVDKKSAKRMIAFKYFNNDIGLLNDYLKDKDKSENNNTYVNKILNPKSQLEFSF